MQYLLGCLGILIVLAVVVMLVQWLFSNLIGVIGLAIAVWAIYQWTINIKLGAKSKMPALLTAAGLLIAFAGFSSAPANETAEPVDSQKPAETVKDEPIAENIKKEPAVSVPPKSTEQPAPAEKSTDTAGTTERIPATLVKVIDGDTIKIRYNGKEQNVRYLLVDTPETNHPRLGKQPFGEEAKKRNAELVENGELEIEFDIGERFDKYDRLLAYIYVDGKSVQKILLSEGLARVAYVYPPNTRHLEPFEKSQAYAKEQKLGIWSVEDYATENGFAEQETAPKPAETEPPAANEQLTAPSTPQPAETEWFQNCTELRKKYPNGVSEDHPAYQPKMDRDKDGWACE